MEFSLGYNTNGFAHHRLIDAINIIAELGYESVALTLDHYALNPYAADLRQSVREVLGALQSRGLECVIETGARFLLDPTHKHRPSLLSVREDDRARRLDFLRRAIDIAADLEASVVSLWSGAKEPELSDADAWLILIDSCDALLSHAARRDVRLAFEPEPGMFIERMDDFARLSSQLQHPRFGMTLDVGHVHCLQDGAPPGRIREFKDHLFNIHIEDMRAGRHEHLMFGEGEMEFPPIFAALKEIGYTGSVVVELSRHSHDAVHAAKQAIEFLRPLAQ